MRVTTWAEYGLIVSVNLARRAGQGPVAARELAEQERLPHALREVHGHDQPVLGPGGDAHEVNMREGVRGFNGSRQSEG